MICDLQWLKSQTHGDYIIKMCDKFCAISKRDLQVGRWRGKYREVKCVQEGGVCQWCIEVCVCICMCMCVCACVCLCVCLCVCVTRNYPIAEAHAGRTYKVQRLRLRNRKGRGMEGVGAGGAMPPPAQLGRMGERGLGLRHRSFAIRATFIFKTIRNLISFL